jgi:hypothetical protein
VADARGGVPLKAKQAAYPGDWVRRRSDSGRFFVFDVYASREGEPAYVLRQEQERSTTLGDPLQILETELLTSYIVEASNPVYGGHPRKGAESLN